MSEEEGLKDTGHDIDVTHLATLARLALSDGEREAVREDLEHIIAMVDVMQSVDTEGIRPMAHPHDATARLRQDRVTEEVDRAVFQAHAPETAEGFYLVPRVVE